MESSTITHDDFGVEQGNVGSWETTGDARVTPFLLGEWTIKPRCNGVVCGDTEVQLEPRVMDVLVFLCRRAGDVVSRRELVDSVWQAEVVADNSINRVIAELRSALGDDARSPRYIQTIPKRGYRVLAEVAELKEESGTLRRLEREPGNRTARRWRIAALAVASVIVAVVAGALSWGTRGIEASRPRIVVLPFENLGDTDTQFFSAGICEEITSRLAALTGVAVISRTSAFNYDPTGKTAAQVGAELGVDYILEGTVRWDRCEDGRQRVRVTPQLIRASDDTHVWADSYERRLEEIFEVQTEIGEQVVQRLGIALRDGERRDLERAPAANAAAYQAYLQGSSFLYSADLRDLAQSITHLERAVALEPDFFLAHARIALCHAYSANFEYVDRSEAGPAARQALARAERIDPTHIEVRRARANVRYYIDHDLEGALEEFQALVDEYPNSSESHAGKAFVLRRLGRWEEFLTELEYARSLDPLNPSHLWNMGSGLFLMRRYEEADAVLGEAARLAPGMRVPHIVRAENYRAWDGDSERARRAIAAISEELSGPQVEQAFLNEAFDGRHQAALDLVRGWPGDHVSGMPRVMYECLCLAQLGPPAESAAVCADAVGRLQAVLESNPDDSGTWMALSHVYGLTSRPDEALRCARRGMEAATGLRDTVHLSQAREELAWTYTLVGQHEAAVGELERLLTVPSRISINSLRSEAKWGPLRDDQRFQTMISG